MPTTPLIMSPVTLAKSLKSVPPATAGLGLVSPCVDLLPAWGAPWLKQLKSSSLIPPQLYQAAPLISMLQRLGSSPASTTGPWHLFPSRCRLPQPWAPLALVAYGSAVWLGPPSLGICYTRDASAPEREQPNSMREKPL